MAKNNTSESAPTINFLGKGTTITGEIISGGDFRIDGQLNGSIDSKGKVVVGSSGNVDGEIACQNADISGAVTGKVAVSELLSLKSTAKIYGDIVTGKLAIEPGAVFTGSCHMGEMPIPDVQTINKNEGTESKEKTFK